MAVLEPGPLVDPHRAISYAAAISAMTISIFSPADAPMDAFGASVPRLRVMSPFNPTFR
jgi:hypothetical protein